MGADNLFHQGQAKPGPFPPFFCGKKRVENLVKGFLAHATAVVLDVNANVMVPAARHNGQVKPGRACPPYGRGRLEPVEFFPGHNRCLDQDPPFALADGMDCIDTYIED